VDVGPVGGVIMNSGVPNILVNGRAYTLDQVQGVAPVPNNSAGSAEEGAQP
jgi:hypothetical protein